MTEWRSVDHVQEAAKEWKVPREPVPSELAREASRGGRYAPHNIQLGETFGDLTVVAVVDQLPNGTKVWICKCACGGEALRSSGQLNRSVRDGGRPCCARCSTEQRGGRNAVRAAALREAYRKQFVDYRTLWLPQQTRALTVGVWNDLVEAFGAPPEEDDDPELPLQQAVGWPYSAVDHRYALRHHDFFVEESDVAEPAESAAERQERELAAKLVEAVESGDQEQLDAAVTDNATFDTVRAKTAEVAEQIQRRLIAEAIAEAKWIAARYDGLRVCRCAWCAQRIAWKPGSGEQACSVPCARQYAAWSKRFAEQMRVHQQDAVAREAARKAGEREAQQRADKERKQQERLEQVRIAREQAAKPQYAVLVPMDGAALGQLVDSLQRQLAAAHNVDAYYVRASFARGHTVLEFKMTNRDDQPLHIILNGAGPGRAAWVIGASSADQAAARVVGRVYVPDVGIPARTA